MSHCLNCGKPLDEHAIAHHDDGATVAVCPTSVYVDVDDALADIGGDLVTGGDPDDHSVQGPGQTLKDA